MDVLSKSRVDKAGDVLRRQASGAPVTLAEFVDALGVVLRYRASWADPPQPLAKVNMGLRSMSRSALNRRLPVAQRLKRLPRIIEKLSRPEHATMRLSQMEDIGGCRVVLQDLDELNRLRKRIERTWSESLVPRLTRDYVAHPKPDGYRAVHLAVVRDGHLIEVQLRTRRQHLWAARVEQLEIARGSLLRGGRAAPVTREAFVGLAAALAMVDSGRQVPEELRQALEAWLAELGGEG